MRKNYITYISQSELGKQFYVGYTKNLKIIWRGREAQAGSSKPDFNNKVRISLREMRESNYPLTSSPRRAG